MSLECSATVNMGLGTLHSMLGPTFSVQMLQQQHREDRGADQTKESAGRDLEAELLESATVLALSHTGHANAAAAIGGLRCRSHKTESRQ